MHICHIAIWTHDIARLERFYAKYFNARVAPHYRNPAKGFESVFLSFDQGAKIEVMQTGSIQLVERAPGAQCTGLTHLALSLGSDSEVDALAARLQAAGYPIIDGPRRTGDGYYECVILDPDGNRIEIST